LSGMSETMVGVGRGASHRDSYGLPDHALLELLL